MKKIKYIMAIGIFMALAATAIFAGTRRTREEEFIRAITNMVEGQTIYIRTKVCDPDGDAVIIEFEDVPEGMMIGERYIILREDAPLTDPNCAECVADPNSSWYGIENPWTPTYEQAGTYKMFIHAFDDKGGDDWVVHIINVADTNRSPVL